MSRTIKTGLAVGTVCLLAAVLCLSIYSRKAVQQSTAMPQQQQAAAGTGKPTQLAIQNSLQWGGALNSATRDGHGFFSAEQSLAFVNSVDVTAKKYVVELNARAFLPQRSDFSQVFSGKHTADKRTAYLQFNDHPTAQQREVLRTHGVEVLSYVTGYAWYARGTANDFEAALNLDFVRAVASIDPRDKLHPDIFAGFTPTFAKTDDGRTRFVLITLPGQSLDSLQQAAGQKPALATAEIHPALASVLGPRFDVVAARESALDLAALDAVTFIEFMQPPVASRDATTDLESDIKDVRDSGPSLSGSGVSVAIRELGKPIAHADFGSRLTYITNGDAASADVDHATAVCGQVASNGGVQPSAKGVAPAVALLAYSVPQSSTTFSSADVVDAASKGARISNHSYGPTGISTFGDYQSVSADWDNAIRANNLLGMFAGNEEPGQTTNHIDYFVGAKNTICVGASNSQARAGDDNPPIAQSDGITSFSQFGPMKDGRIKPDLVAYGEFVTLDQGSAATQVASGTSFATPTVTGVAALVDQEYKAVTGNEPSGALLKALLCNSASDLGNKGPDVVYGFGIVNAKAAVNTIALQTDPSNGPFFEGTLSNGQSANFTINIQGTAQLKATLCWMDVSGVPAAAKALVNDLDLTLVDPNGVTHYPFSINPASPLAPATATGPNTVDPIEQVIIDAPISGIWTVFVKGTSIPQGSQPFAVCVNVPRQPVPLVAQIQASPIQGEAPLTVSFTSQGSAGTITSYVWNFGDGTQDTSNVPSLSHTYESIGTFTASLTITDANNNQSTASVTITVLKPHPATFPTRFQAHLVFPSIADKDRVSFVLTARNLVMTAQQSREALRDGTFEGKTFNLTINGVNIPNISGVAPIILDRKASYKSFFISVRHNFTQGQIIVTLSKQDLSGIFQGNPPPSDPVSSGVKSVKITIETPDAIYESTFNATFKSNGKTASARN
jgi:PKD repeat protein/subtilisin family serine protease